MIKTIRSRGQEVEVVTRPASKKRLTRESQRPQAGRMTAIEYITRVHALCARPRGFSAMVKAYGFNPRKERDKECVLENMGDLVCGREELTDLDVQILEEAEASMKRSKK